MKRVLILSLGLLFLFSFPLASSVPSQESKVNYKDAVGYCKELLNSSAKKGPRRQWLYCLKMMKARAKEPAALLIIGQIYERLYSFSRARRDLEGATGAYRRLADEYPRRDEAAEALFRLGRALYLAKRKGEGKELLQRLFVNYPESPWAREARAFLPGEAKPRRLYVGSPRPKSEAAWVYGIRQWAGAGYSRLIIDLEQKVKYSYSLLASGEGPAALKRLYLDLEKARLRPGVKETIPVESGPLKRIRSAQHDTDTVRVVLDLDRLDSYKVFPLEHPFRLVIDLLAKEERLPREKNLLSSGLASNSSLGRVVIDPGHGGDDPGAIGKDGLKEKDVALKLSKRLKELLSQELGVQVLLTREEDIFVPLEERTAFANTKGADLFISVHANASPSQGTRGIETYYLNASADQRSLEVAARENATTVQGLSDLKAILNDLLLNSKIQESSRLAGSIHSAVISRVEKRIGKARDLGVKQAPFYVLMGAQMPSILLEASFITNGQDSRLLRDEGFIDSLARGILEGIKTYLNGSGDSLSLR